jgi:hypothetical protein
MSERYRDNDSENNHGLGYILRRVKSGLADAARNLISGETEVNVRDYLPVNSDEHRITMIFINDVQKKFHDNPELEREGWEEIWLPSAVEAQGWRITRAQAERLRGTTDFRRKNEGVE